MKAACPPKELCKRCPFQYVQYFDYCNRLDFDEKPDYTVLKGLIEHAAASKSIDLKDG